MAPTRPEHRRPATDAEREVVFVAFDGMQTLDLTGPFEVFHGAGQVAAGQGVAGYRLTVVGPTDAPVHTSSGLTIHVDGALGAVDRPFDTLVVVGGDGVQEVRHRPEVIAHVARLAAASRRVTSVCSGAFLLAEAGLLDDRRATTHWSRCAQLAAEFPRVHVEPDPIFTRDGQVATSAGVTAGMDLALALVEEDLGRDAALTIAQWLVLFLRRPGNQAQFSTQLRAQLADRDELRELQHWIVDHPGDDCTVDALAHRAGVSPRHLARLFVEQVGVTPARYVEGIRVERARRRLSESSDPVEAIAASCGFGTGETMRRTFVRTLGMPPAEYRRRFQAATA